MMGKKMGKLSIKNLHAETEGKQILKGVSLEISSGEIIALMGPNGAGKSSLGYMIMGHPGYKLVSGQLKFNGKDIKNLSPDERAKLGLFLSFQQPVEIPGVSLASFLKTAVNSRLKKKLKVDEFIEKLKNEMKLLKIDESFMHRGLNEGFSGGEKKRFEILQLALLRPEIAILDEPDSGLDVDSLKIVANGIKNTAESGTGILLITHYQRIFNYLKPNRVCIMKSGKIIKSGGPELIQLVESKGYEGME
jgi:Fe-S cluster assembly ATP-binding protein